jgi:hypothetical protein
MVAVYTLQFAVANFLVGYLAGLLATMPGFDFWLLHAGIMLLAGLALFLVRKVAGSTLAPEYQAP